MKKILTLDKKALTSGRTHSKWTDGGIWDTAQGLSPFIDSDLYRGIVAPLHTPTDMTGATVVDIPIAHAVDQRGSTNSMYIMGASGNFYSVNPNNVVSNLRSGANVIPSPANGVAIMQAVGGSAQLFYTRETRIGSWDLSGTYPTGWNDSAFTTNINTTIHKPMHKFDRVTYYGNKNYVGYLYDDGAAAIASEPQGLALNPLEVCTAISDDGRYVIVGASQPVTESYDTNTSCRVIWWNGGTDEVIWQARIPNESSIRAIETRGGMVHVVGSRNTYIVQLGVEDSRTVYSFASDEAIPYDGTNYGNPNCIAPLGNGIVFGALGTAIDTHPDGRSIVYSPLHGVTGNISWLTQDYRRNTLYVGTRSSKLYRFDLSSAGSTTETWVTRALDLGDQYYVNRMRISLPNGIGGSDSLGVSLIADDGDTTTETITITQATRGDVKYVDLFFNNTIKTSRLRISLAPSAGIPSFDGIEIYGDRATA